MTRSSIAACLSTAALLFGCDSSGVPDSLQQQLKQMYASQYDKPDNFQFAAAGTGQILPDEKSQGVEQVLCVKVQFMDTKYNVTSSQTGLRTKSQWRFEEGIEAWQKHGCAGEFKIGVGLRWFASRSRGRYSALCD